MASADDTRRASRELSGRQAQVLRAVVTAYVGEAAPIGSSTLSHLLPVPLSSASIRNTLAELSSLGLVEQPHPSAGRVPTEAGLRLFVHGLLDPAQPPPYDVRSIDWSLAEADADAVAQVASQLLSECTRQLGFVVSPRLDQVVLRHLSLVRLSTERLLVVLVSETSETHRRIVRDRRGTPQPELDRMASLLNARIAGHTLGETRELLAREARSLRHQADAVLLQALQLGGRALAPAQHDPTDLVIATRLALLDQPEFNDPRRLRDLFAALETKERLVEILDRMLAQGGVRVAIGDEVDDPGLRRCALVAARYGSPERPLGALGVIGPCRMDYARVISLVEYLSRVVTRKLCA